MRRATTIALAGTLLVLAAIAYIVSLKKDDAMLYGQVGSSFCACCGSEICGSCDPSVPDGRCPPQYPRTEVSKCFACARKGDCGNGTVESWEECDNGMACFTNFDEEEPPVPCSSNNQSHCKTKCQPYTDTKRKCSAECKFLYCGDGRTDFPTEECDYGKHCSNGVNCQNNPNDCPAGADDCMVRAYQHCGSNCFNLCGNGVIDTGEYCDNGRRCLDSALKFVPCSPEKKDHCTSSCMPFDAPLPSDCSKTCQRMLCGDSTVNPGEQCDPGKSCPDGTICNSDADCNVNSGLQGIPGGGIGSTQFGGNFGLSDPHDTVWLGDDAVKKNILHGEDDDEEEEEEVCIVRPRNNCNADCRKTCGNNILDPDEQCDNGGLCNNPDVDLECSTFDQDFCGDGLECNPVDGDGCDRFCRWEVCGNNILQSGEGCDDGNNISGDGCSAECKVEVCGNGRVDPGEQCDLGVANNAELGCSKDCKTTCGDKKVQGHLEQCDDGNQLSGDGCDEHCFLECGNGIQDIDESCDPGSKCLAHTDYQCSDTTPCSNPPSIFDCNENPSDCKPVMILGGTDCTGNPLQCIDAIECVTRSNNPECNNHCLRSRCGDGVVNELLGEECDDGGTCTNNPAKHCFHDFDCFTPIPYSSGSCQPMSNDDCSATCKRERCGDGIIQPPDEQCEPPFTEVCNGFCRLMCGNGILDPGEECDPEMSQNCSKNCKNSENQAHPDDSSLMMRWMKQWYEAQK